MRRETSGARRSITPAICLLLLPALAALAGCTAAAPGHRQARGHGGASISSHSRRHAFSRADPARARSTGGRLLTLRIPGRVSHFRARPAVVYLPPAAQRRSAPRLPVLLLLHGTPGAPSDWVRKGDVKATLDRFAALHHGRAPIVVMPDINGATHADSECVSAGRGNVERYLAEDVRRYVQRRFRVDGGPRSWAIAGLSEGGMCSLMLSLRHPSAFATLGDLSGLARPTVGRHDDPPATIRELFHGSRRDYDHHDPLWLMRRHTYPTLAAWFECGQSDAQVVQAQAAVTHAARQAGLSVRHRVVPGGHSWSVWRAALPAMLPWLWQRMIT